jgi:hypothetical protein
MAINVDELRNGLTDYRETLRLSNDKLAQEFDNLQQNWLALRQTYEGQGAEEFAYAWAQTAEWFEKYFDEIRGMTAYLEERTEQLHKL